MNELLLTIREAAKLLCIAEKTARNWLTQGKFPVATFKIGARRVVRKIDLVKFIEGLGAFVGVHPVLSVTEGAIVQQKKRGRPRKV
jgi:Helix-turn-helix domain